MIARLVWTAALLVVAGLTAVLQLDREADLDPAVAPLVPAPFSAYAQTQRTARALEGSDPAAALSEARALVRRRPMPAESLTLLAAAEAKAGDAQAAGRTIQLAGQRGWREPVAQEAVLRLALAAGDRAEAARRYAALFRREATPDALLIALAPQVLGEPGGAGQEAFAVVLAGAPRWHELYLRRGPVVLPLPVFASILGMATERGGTFDCAALRRAADTLRQRDAAAAGAMAAPIARRCSAAS